MGEGKEERGECEGGGGGEKEGQVQRRKERGVEDGMVNKFEVMMGGGGGGKELQKKEQ